MFHGIKHSADNPIRVAFLLYGGKQWLGGYNYLRNLCKALHTYRNDIQPVLFVGNDTETEMLKPFHEIDVEVVTTALFDKAHKHRLFIESLLYGMIRDVERLFTRSGIDVIFENSVYFGWRTKFPVVTWLPDFQHKHLPGMFSKLAWLKREFGFRIITTTSRYIMLSSNDAKKDCQSFYNVSDERIFVVPFAVDPPAVDSEYVKICLRKYNIDRPFFFLPNQLWRHKNHKVVIEALRRCHMNHRYEALVISSGANQDTRNSDYFGEVQALISEYNLDDSFRMLGMIPYRDVVHLMYGSIAVINPSLFEGWSSTVEEAKALQKTLILSNIPVHCEQVKKSARFFNPYAPDELADILEALQDEHAYGDPAMIDNSKYVEQYAQRFAKMITVLTGSQS